MDEQSHLLIILALLLQRANLTLGSARFAYRAPVRDEVEMERIVEVRGNKRFEENVRLLAGGLLRNPAQALRHTKDVGVYRKCGRIEGVRNRLNS